jgi:hypothetical protein
MEFTARALFPYFQCYSSTGLRLVLREVYCMGLASIPSVLLRLLVYDWYYVEFTARALFPYFYYYSVYWFTTGTACILLQGLCSRFQ